MGGISTLLEPTQAPPHALLDAAHGAVPLVLVHCLLTDDDSSAFSLRLRTNEVCIRAHSARCAHRRHGTGERTQLEESGPRSWWLTADRLVCAQWLRDESACAGVSVSDTNWQRPSFCMFSCITARFIMKETQHETQRMPLPVCSPVMVAHRERIERARADLARSSEPPSCTLPSAP